MDGILEVLARLFLRSALGDRAGDLRARGDDTAVFSVLVDRGKSLHALNSLLALVRPDLRAPPRAPLQAFVWWRWTRACPARCGEWCSCARRILRSSQIWTLP